MNLRSILSLRQVFRLQVDKENNITFVNAAWERFAVENDAPELAGQQVIGTNIFDYIAGADDRKMHSLLLDAVRRTGRTAEYRFRCDSPEGRRYMVMTVSPLRSGMVEYRSRIERFEKRGSPAIIFARNSARSEATLTACSWCRRILVDREWLEADHLKVLRFLDRDRMPQLSSGICDDCRNRFLDDIRPLHEVFKR
jgi:hypothetical protein